MRIPRGHEGIAVMRDNTLRATPAGTLPPTVDCWKSAAGKPGQHSSQVGCPARWIGGAASMRSNTATGRLQHRDEPSLDIEPRPPEKFRSTVPTCVSTFSRSVLRILLLSLRSLRSGPQTYDSRELLTCTKNSSVTSHPDHHDLARPTVAPRARVLISAFHFVGALDRESRNLGNPKEADLP